MNYWKFPDYGTGSYSYYYDGADDCNGEGSGQLSVNFSDAYDWDNIIDNYNGSYNRFQADAVSELCYEIAVSMEMDFDSSGSEPGIGPFAAMEVLP